MRIIAALAAFASLTLVPAAPGHAEPAPPRKSAPAKAKCEHGVQRSICTRCYPKLIPVYKSKGDWCPEHERPESQCVLCHPELARKGIK